MIMPDGVTMLGIGVSLFGLGTTIHLAIDGFIRIKRLERERQPPPSAANADTAMLAARLERIEQIVEVTAVEVERIAEGQRYVARTLAEQQRALPASRAPERVVTPH